MDLRVKSLWSDLTWGWNYSKEKSENGEPPADKKKIKEEKEEEKAEDVSVLFRSAFQTSSFFRCRLLKAFVIRAHCVLTRVF